MAQTLTLLMSSSFNPALPKPDDALVKKMTSSSVNFEDNREAYLKEKIDFMKAIYGSRYILNEEKEQVLIIEDEIRKSSSVRPYRQIVALVTYIFNPNVLIDIQAPTIVIHGNEDPLFSIEHATDLKNNISDSQLIIKKGMGHAIPDSLFPSLVKDISNFIAKAE